MDNPSNFTWPALLAKELGYIYSCHAQGGIGNMAISYNVLKRYATSHFKNRNFYVINWTWIERFDYMNTDLDNKGNIWETIHATHQNKLSHFFYKHIDNQVWNLLRNLQIIHSTIEFLKDHDCDFFMTCLDDNLLGKNYAMQFTDAISTLQSCIRPYINTIENKNFYSWSVEKTFPMGPNGHPLEQAHAHAAEYWLKKIKHQLRFEDLT